MRKPAIFNVSSGDAVIFFSSSSTLLVNYSGSLFGSLDNLHEFPLESGILVQDFGPFVPPVLVDI